MAQSMEKRRVLPAFPVNLGCALVGVGLQNQPTIHMASPLFLRKSTGLLWRPRYQSARLPSRSPARPPDWRLCVMDLAALARGSSSNRQ